MPFILPLLSIALAVLAQLAFKGSAPPPWRWDSARLAALVLLSALAGWLTLTHGQHTDGAALRVGLVLGVVATGIMSGRPRQDTNLLPPLAAGLAAASAIHILATPVQEAGGLGLLFGAGLGALVLGGEAAASAVVATVVVAADYLCARHYAASATPYLGSLAALLALVGGILAARLSGRLAFLRAPLAALLVVAGGYFATQAISDRNLMLTLLAGVAAAVAVDWLLAEEEADAVRFGLAAIISIGVATLAFGLAKGAGMGLALCAATTLLLAVGNRRAVLCLGPLLGLTLFRVLAEAHPGASHALDIGQHYALLGLTLGAVLPLIPADWLRRDGMVGAAGALLWGLIPLAIPPLVLVMFGEKGAIGFVVGVGFSSLCQALRKETGLLPAAISGAMATGTILSLQWMTSLTDMDRDEKVKAFKIAALAIVVVAIVLALLSRGKSTAGRLAEATQ